MAVVLQRRPLKARYVIRKSELGVRRQGIREPLAGPAATMDAAASYPFNCSGRQARARADLRPHEAMETLKEVTQWLRVRT